jgi:hypothetical protein
MVMVPRYQRTARRRLVRPDRAHSGLDDRQRSQDAFYGSDEWRQGPREEILRDVESYTSVVLELEPVTTAALRLEL